MLWRHRNRSRFGHRVGSKTKSLHEQITSINGILNVAALQLHLVRLSCFVVANPSASHIVPSFCSKQITTPNFMDRLAFIRVSCCRGHSSPVSGHSRTGNMLSFGQIYHVVLTLCCGNTALVRATTTRINGI